MKKLIVSLIVMTAVFAQADTEAITGVTAKQRWPWNNLVDVDFTLENGVAGEFYRIEIEAQCATGSEIYRAATFVNEPVVNSGAHRVTWDFGRDYPNVKATNMVFTVSATPASNSEKPLYMVVDISGGKTANSYPVRYTSTAPVFTVGQNDPCKTTEIWLKRVFAGTFTAGNGAGSSSNYYPEHTCVLSNDFYVGIFPVTKAQKTTLGWTHSNCYDHFTNETCAATRPLDWVSPKAARENLDSDTAPKSASLLYFLNQRTGLVFDLPTEWQWEYAARAGGEGCDAAQIRNSTNVSTSGVDQNSTEEVGTSYVDRYPPNAWGLYGMQGNVWEVCKNVFTNVTRGATLVDPCPNGSGRGRRRRGGAWNSADTATKPYSANTAGDYWTAANVRHTGVRIFLSVKNK